MIIVTGSSGFIGNRVSHKFLDLGHIVFGIDINPALSDLSRRDNFADVKLDINDKIAVFNFFEHLSKITNETPIVCHLAALIKVDEAEEHPNKYYQTNLLGTIYIFQALDKYFHHRKDKRFLFASTAAVYGYSTGLPFIEDDTTRSTTQSIYGKTKYMAEQYIIDNIKMMNSVIFRFFNVSGGLDTDPHPHHLIPVVINNLKHNKDILIFGDDYQTKDGTCIRDYVHVDDIAEAFVLASICELKGSITYNLGSGTGFTVKEIISKCLEIYSIKNKVLSQVKLSSRRPGDPDALLADISKTLTSLHWSPKRTLEQIITDTIDAYMKLNE